MKCDGITQDICTCRTGYISKHIATIDSAQLNLFLKTFSDQRCEKNIEYLEYSNETLFKVIEKRPALLFENLFSLPENEAKNIKKIINTPLLDQNWLKLYLIIIESSLNGHSKIRAIKIIKEAYYFDTDSMKVRVPQFDKQ
jgi:hypothetical protein